MDAEPHKSERGETKGTLIFDEEGYLPEGTGSLGVQPLNMIKADTTNNKER